jgi:hypothetical protein
VRILLLVVASIVLLLLAVVVIGALLPKRHVWRVVLLIEYRPNSSFP